MVRQRSRPKLIVAPHDGKNIQQVLGASRLGTDQGYQYLVHVTGYPNSENVPITCVNWTSRFSADPAEVRMRRLHRRHQRPAILALYQQAVTAGAAVAEPTSSAP